MKIKPTIIAGIALIMLAGCVLVDSPTGGAKSATMNCRYAVLFLYPEVRVVAKGDFSIERYQKLFKTDYLAIGEHPSPPDSSRVVGVLVVSDQKSAISLPIVSWDNPGIGPMYLCQSAEFNGKAPMFSAAAEDRENFVTNIRAKLLKQ